MNIKNKSITFRLFLIETSNILIFMLTIMKSCDIITADNKLKWFVFK